MSDRSIVLTASPHGRLNKATRATLRRAEQAKRFAALDAALERRPEPRAELGSPCDGSDFEAHGGTNAKVSDLPDDEDGGRTPTASIRGEASSVDAEPGEGPKEQFSDQSVQFGTAPPTEEAEFGPQSLADLIPGGTPSEPQRARASKLSKLNAALEKIAAERRVPPVPQSTREQSGTEPDLPQCSERDRSYQ